MKKGIFTLVLLLHTGGSVFASTDSLLRVFNNETQADTSRVRAIHFAAWNLLYQDTDSTRLLAGMEMEFAEEKKLPLWELSAINTYGLSYFLDDNYPKALEWFQKLLAKADQQDTVALSSDELEFFKMNKANAWHNMGNVYLYMGDYSRAEKHYVKSLQIKLQSKERQNLSGTYTNLGLVSRRLGQFDKALEYFRRSLSIDELSNDKKGISDNLINIGSIHQDLLRHDSAVFYYKKALHLFEELSDQYGILNAYLGMGYSAQVNGLLNDALINCKKALQMAEDLNDAYNEQFCYKCLFETYEKKGDWKNAFYSYRKWNQIQDSLFGADKTRELTSLEMQFDFQKKELKDSLLIEEERKLTRLREAEQEARLEKERFQRYVLYAGLFVFLFFGIFIYNRFLVTRRQKKIIESQKTEVEKQKYFAEEQHRIAELQKEIVEEKNKEIIDSINYAKRLQEAILPPVRVFEEYLKDSFLLYQPKDIVAGDFYWFVQQDNKLFFAAADCTGHGVPGALVSVVCSNALNRTVKEFRISSPEKILDKVRELVIETFSLSHGEVKDGMDISLCCLEEKDDSFHLHWAGANNPLWLIRAERKEIEEIKGDKQPVGFSSDLKPFSNRSLLLQRGDCIYVFTDGYADQFGGDKGKKFKSSNLRELIFSIQEKPMQEQRNHISSAFESWKGDLEQVDDVCMIGVRL